MTLPSTPKAHRLRGGDAAAGVMLTTAATKDGGSRLLDFVSAAARL